MDANLLPKVLGEYRNFPIQTTVEDMIPESIWPNMPGVQTAKIKEYQNTVTEWKKFWTLALKYPLVSIDTETNGLRPTHGDRLIGIACSFYDGKIIHAGYWNFRHKGHPAHCNCPSAMETKCKLAASARAKCKHYCKGYIEKAQVIPLSNIKDVSKVHATCIVGGQNYKFDIKVLYYDGVIIPNRVLDTMLIAHLWDENRGRYNLEVLGAEIGSPKKGDLVKDYMDAHRLTPKGHGHEQVPYEVERPYAIQDTIVVLKRLQWERERWLKLQDPRIMQIFQIENGCSPAVAQREINGMQLDMKFLKWGVNKLRTEIVALETKVYKLAKKKFDINSGQQLWEILEKRGFVPTGYTEKSKAHPEGIPITDASALESYKDPFCSSVNNYKKMYKSLNTYFGPFLETHTDKDGRLHCENFIHGTVSGRMCVSGDTVLETTSGPVEMSKLSIYDILAGVSIMSHANRLCRIRTKYYKGREEMFAVTLQNRATIKCTMQHAFLTPFGWMGLCDLSIGKKVCTPEGKSAITSIVPVGVLDVWDIEVEHDHSYFAQGFVNHNSSREPNLQNITRFEKFSTIGKTGTLAKAVQDGLKYTDMIDDNNIETRRCFVPRSADYSLFYFDYAQMELRLFAEIAEETFLQDALLRGEDMHEATARSVFPNFPTKEQNKVLFGYFRQLAKQINFGIIYGMGRNKLAQQLSVPVDETVRALELMELCYKEMPGCAKDFSEYTQEELKERLASHRLMTATWKWDGLRTLGMEVKSKINAEGLSKLLVSDTKNMRLMYSAQQFLDRYHARFPKIKQLQKTIKSTIAKRGYIFNKYGRRYHLDENRAYVGVNRLVQGICSDMVKLAECRIHKLLLGKKSLMTNQVHDEGQFELHYTELDLVPEIKACMETFPMLKVGIQTECDYSHVAWSEKRGWHGVEEFLEADKRPYSKEKLKVLKQLYGWYPGKIVPTKE